MTINKLIDFPFCVVKVNKLDQEFLIIQNQDLDFDDNFSTNLESSR
jgi:hypothetical protein